MEEADVVEIPPPVNWVSNAKSLKRKEVLCPNIIDVDDYEDCSVTVLDSGKSDARFKGKQTYADFSLHSSAGTHNNVSRNNVKSTGSSYEGSHYSNEGFYKDYIYVDDDDQMEYALLQSHLDEFDIPTGIEVSIPWVTDDYGNNMNSFTGSASTQSTSRVQNDPNGFPSWNKSYHTPWHSETEHAKAKYTSGDGFQPHVEFDTKKLNPSSKMPAVSGNVQLSSSSYSGRKTGAPQAYGLHGNSDRRKKPPPPHVHVLHSIPNQISTAANNFPKAPMLTGYEKPLELHEQSLHSLQNRMSIASNTFPKASIPTGNESFYNPGLNANKSMSSNVDLNHEFPGYNFTAQNPSTAASYLSGGFNFFDSTAFNPLFPNSVGIQKDLTSTGKVSSSSGPSSSKILNENAEVISKKFDLFKKFDTIEDYSDHFFSQSNAFAMNQPTRSWAKKIQGEWKILEKDLPDTIFVRVYESRMDLLRAAIIGAQGTPYHDGLFFFDMFFPNNYPNVPPQVKYHSGGLRINPNLYNCGKVCLSLLNTWNGSGKEMWIPGESTVLQVLVSIQGLILNEKPYFNEPGYEYSGGTVTGENRSFDYNEKTFIYSLKTMVYSIRKPPKHFEDLVVGHYFKRAHDILVACRAYKNGAQVGSVVGKGAVANVNNKVQKGNSKKFKNDLAACLKTLVEAFAQIGVKDCGRFLY